MDYTSIVKEELRNSSSLKKQVSSNSDIISAFNIRAGEEILGYYECRDGVIGLGKKICMVFTQSAIYLNPSMDECNADANTRIEYMKLCDYICSGNDILYLYASYGKLCIIKGSLIGAFSDLGKEIANVLWNIGNEFEKDDNYMSGRERLYKATVNSCEALVRNHDLDESAIEDTARKLKGLSHDLAYSKKAVWQMLKLAVITMNYTYLEDICQVMASGDINVLERDFESEFKQITSANLALLKRYDVDINGKLLQLLIDNKKKSIKHYEKVDNKGGLTGIYYDYLKAADQVVKIRFSKNLNRYYFGIKEDISDNDLLNRLTTLKAESIDEKMLEAFEYVKNGEVVDPKDYPECDSLGFTVLHYAILLHKDDQIERCLKNVKIENHSKDDNVIECAYDYMFIACMQDNQDLFTKIYANSDDMLDLEKIHKELELKLKIYNVGLGVAGAIGGMGKFALKQSEKELRKGTEEFTYDDVAAYRNVVENYDDDLSYKSEMYDMLFEEAQQIRQEILECTAAAYELYVNYIRRNVENSNNRIVGILKKFYNSPEYIEKYLKANHSSRHTLESESARRVFCLIDSIIEEIFLHNWWDIAGSSNADEHDENNGTEQTIQFSKPYGNNWFSPKAHSDLKTMNKEYHILANKYHPDNNPDSLEIFLAIQQERLAILESIK